MLSVRVGGGDSYWGSTCSDYMGGWWRRTPVYNPTQETGTIIMPTRHIPYNPDRITQLYRGGGYGAARVAVLVAV